MKLLKEPMYVSFPHEAIQMLDFFPPIIEVLLNITSLGGYE